VHFLRPRFGNAAKTGLYASIPCAFHRPHIYFRGKTRGFIAIVIVVYSGFGEQLADLGGNFSETPDSPYIQFVYRLAISIISFGEYFPSGFDSLGLSYNL
jgi:hypothetical protein